MEQRLSFCLAHQDRPTDVRCSACLKPICEECTFTTNEGKFCSNSCHEKRLQSNERVKALKEEEERERLPRLIRKLISWALKILFLVALYFCFQMLPVAWKGWIVNNCKVLWKTITAAFK